jgi:hypothetical protein
VVPIPGSIFSSNSLEAGARRALPMPYRSLDLRGRGDGLADADGPPRHRPCPTSYPRRGSPHWRRVAQRWQLAQAIVRSLHSAARCCLRPSGHEPTDHERAVKERQSAMAQLPLATVMAPLQSATVMVRLRPPLALVWDCSAWPVAENASCSIGRPVGQVASRCCSIAPKITTSPTMKWTISARRREFLPTC